VSYSWAKLWIEMIDDRKTASLPDSSWRRFVELILLAMETNRGGVLPAVPDMAWRLRVTTETMGDDMTRLALAGLVHLNDKDEWVVTNFTKRQAAVPVTERVASHRERKRREKQEEPPVDETPEQRDSNDNVTAELSNGNEHVTIRSTDKTRLDQNRQEEKESGAAAPPHPPATSPHFQPVSEAAQKRKRIDDLLAPSPMPSMVATAPPAMLLMKTVTGHWPGENNREFLVENLGHEPDEAVLRAAFKLWSASGYKSTNYRGICQWYQELLRDPAWTPDAQYKAKANGNGRGQPAPPKSVSTPAPGSQPVRW